MGGGDLRTARKLVAALGVANGSHRGVPMLPSKGQSSTRAPLPTSAAVSSQGVKAETAELVMEAGEPMPRVVFNAAPSFQEANAATTALKEAMDLICLSNSGDKHEVFTEGGSVSVQSPHSELEIKSCESELVPQPALQAFQLLSASPKVQKVLASIFFNHDVWNVVSQNSVLKDFLQSQEKVAGFEPKKSNIKLEKLSESDDKTSSPRNGFFHSFNVMTKKYLTNSSDKHEVSTEGSRVSVQSPHSELETKSCESELVPKHALQAFQLLSASPEVQTVVASLISDRIVWSAISQNSMLNDFLQSQENGFEPKEELPHSDDETGFRHRLNDLVQKMKLTVAGMLSSVSSYYHSFFGSSSPEKSVSSYHHSFFGSSSPEKSVSSYHHSLLGSSSQEEMGSDGAEKPNTLFTDPMTIIRIIEILLALSVVVAKVVLSRRA